MSSTSGARDPEQDGPACVVQIYSRLLQDASASCLLQIGAADSTRTVIGNAVSAMGLEPGRAYSLLEVRRSGRDARPLEARDRPLQRVLLWPAELQRWHPPSRGHYFVLHEQQVSSGDEGARERDDDLCDLAAVTEENVLQVLHRRFDRLKIYTYTRNILLAVNPYKFLPDYYNPKYVKMYENQPLGKLSPHVFAVAEAAYRAMLSRQADQCIVMSGESGSGKTESSGFLIHCLTALSQKTCSSGLERTVLGAGLVLEAFGNARTAENNNSSRFGRFVQLNFLESGVIRGAVIEKYLLEKCRLVSKNKNERNFHVFYYLLAGASIDEQEDFHLLRPQDYLYLKQKDLCFDDEDKLGHDYKRLHQAMEMVGFLPSTKKHIFSILSSILLLGNVTYTASEHSQDLEVGPADVLSTLCDLLKVKQENLVKALTKRTTVTTKATVVSPYTLQQAFKIRDSMAKSLYGALFDWIVLHINHTLLNRRDMEESVSCLSIGVLDLFGFENLQTNSLEQLCINYANEKLQHYVTQIIFKLDQEEYASEGITWQNINYTDNSGCIELISGKPTGLFDLLERSVCQTTDETLLDKLTQHHQDNKCFVLSPIRRLTFGIQHFAGRVYYDIKDFREKNTEHMRPEVVSLLRSSDRAFLRHLIASNPIMLFRWGILRATIRIVSVFKMMGRQRAQSLVVRRKSLKSLSETRHRSSAVDRLSSVNLDFSFDNADENPLEVFEDIFATFEMRKKNRGSRKKQVIPKNLMNVRSLQHVVSLTAHDRTSKSTFHPHLRTKPLTMSARFQASVQMLMETIEKAEPFLIFCVRSNSKKEELQFDEDLVLHQIRYMGIVQMVEVQKSGYSAKYTFKEFAEKFRMLLPKGCPATQESITYLLEGMELDKSTYQIGKSKVFLKEKERQLLQDTLNREVMRHIITLQRWIRSVLLRIHYLQSRDARRIMERNWREFYLFENRAATVIQTAWRSSQKRLKEHREQEEAAKLGQDSSTKTLPKQNKVEQSPNRTQQPDPDDGQSVQPQRDGQEGRAPLALLNRPFSVPEDTTLASDNRSSSLTKSSSLQRSSKDPGDMKEKRERWKERYSEDQRGESVPELFRGRYSAKDISLKMKSFSVDDMSHVHSSGSDISSSTSEVTVRPSNHPKRKRHLANTRSHLMFNWRLSEEDEWWNFPLPPDSPLEPNQKISASLAADLDLESRVKIQIEPDGMGFCIPSRSSSEDLGQHESSHSPLTTPERIWFIGRFLKKRAAKHQTPNNESSDKTVTLPRYNTHPYYAPNQNPKASRNPTIRISRATRAVDINASLDRVITDPKELRILDEFLGNQVNELQTRMKKLSPTENIFFQATKDFRETIKGMYSLEKPQIGYKDLMKGYHTTVCTLAGAQQEAEVPMVVNLFQSVLDGFIRGELKRMESEPSKATKTKRKGSKCLDLLDHPFSTYQVNVVQTCDICTSHIRGMEKACICSACDLVCHKKCLNRIETHCSKRAKQNGSLSGSLYFGVQVSALISDTNPVPKVMEMLLFHVELNGLYTEGIYRKSGSACRAKELQHVLDTDPEHVCLENYPIHTITGLVKRWLRELPDPLMTFSRYGDFLHAVELPEKAERIKAIYQKIDELPPANYATLERLIFHLVRVAKEEEHNKMSPEALAIVFAPCILRTPDSDDPFLCMKDVPRTTLCVETLICEQLRRYTEKMKNINELEFAEALAVNQLKLRRQNTVVERPPGLHVPEPDADEMEKTLIERIKSIKQEKVDLVIGLPDLEQDNFDNFDSDILMSSLNSDSLEDILRSMGWEGKAAMQPTTKEPERQDNATGTMPAVRSVRAQTDVHITPDVAQSRNRQGLSSQTNQGTRESFSGRLDPDIPYIDEDEV
ncbi:unconventional myosin-IXb isoform X2 [Betta splendens]|uniref:Unconventional myosin-IXb isoform X2 n=1 Tax=Betta splendens TaxID=158456 RepID=A0A9W2XDK5_BETSP|nr:unconventional myosin-IXb isoform X2 [Betta splendens]